MAISKRGRQAVPAVEKELSWYGGYLEAVFPTLTLGAGNIVEAGGVFPQTPRMVATAGGARLASVAFPIGITRGRPCTIRRTALSWSMNPTSVFSIQPATYLYGIGIYRTKIDDADISDIATTPPTPRLNPLQDYRDSWMLHEQGIFPAQTTTGGTNYHTFTASGEWDSENMRKFGDNEVLMFNAAIMHRGGGSTALDATLRIAYRFLIQW